MRVLAIGDVFARPGRDCLGEQLPRLKRLYKPDVVIANAENAAHGYGVTRKITEELFSMGVDVLTGGNHSFDNAEYYDFADQDHRILRPANYPENTPGFGWTLVPVGSRGNQIAMINLIGRVFSHQNFDCPFRKIDEILKQIPKEVTSIFVDFHAEATSEKQAMGWYLDGRVSLIWGTHTHVATADERILPNGTAYISDIGMTGVEDSILGMRKDYSLERFLTSRPLRLEPAEGQATLHGIITDINITTGKAIKIQRIIAPE